MDEFYNRHYITVDDQSRITDGWSDGPYTNRSTENAIRINDKGGYQFRLFPGGEENPALFDVDGIPLYRWDGSQVVRRAKEEINAERAALPVPEAVPTAQEDTDAMLVDHEYRITLLELGVIDNAV